MRLFIVRHGETRWNAEGRFQGQKDTELNERGEAQAVCVARHLAALFAGRPPFAAVVGTPLQRSWKTAENIRNACKHTEALIMEPLLTEIHHGDWEGLLSSEVSARWPEVLAMWHAKPEAVQMPGEGGESLRQVCERSVRGVEKLRARFSGDVCAVLHDAVIKVLLCRYLDAPLASFWRFRVPNCSLTVLDFSKPYPQLLLMGDISFLETGLDSPEQKGL